MARWGTNMIQVFLKVFTGLYVPYTLINVSQKTLTTDQMVGNFQSLNLSLVDNVSQEKL